VGAVFKSAAAGDGRANRGAATLCDASCGLVVGNLSAAGAERLMQTAGLLPRASASASATASLPLWNLTDGATLAHLITRGGSMWRRWQLRDVLLPPVAAADAAWVVAYAAVRSSGCVAGGGLVQSATATVAEGAQTDAETVSVDRTVQRASEWLGSTSIVASLATSAIAGSGAQTGTSLQTVALALTVRRLCSGSSGDESGSSASASLEAASFGQSLIDSPLQLSLGGLSDSDGLNRSGGVLVGDLVLVLAVWAMATVIQRWQAIAAVALHWEACRSQLSALGCPRGMSRAGALLHLFTTDQPGPLSGGFGLMFQPMLTAAITLAAHDSTWAVRALGVCGLVLLLLPVVVLMGTLLRCEIAAHRVASRGRRAKRGGASGCVERIAAPRTRWVPRRGAVFADGVELLRRYGNWLEELREGCHYFPVIDLAVSIAVAVVGGVTLEVPDVCGAFADVSLVLLASISGVYWVVMLARRPCETPLSSCSMMLLQGITVLSCALTAGHLDAAAAWATLVQSLLATLLSVAGFAAVVFLRGARWARRVMAWEKETSPSGAASWFGDAFGTLLPRDPQSSSQKAPRLQRPEDAVVICAPRVGRSRRDIAPCGVAREINTETPTARLQSLLEEICRSRLE
jgi:hypothetical protein